jgi:ferredoxin/flavodoxin---NADP+ reductase
VRDADGHSVPGVYAVGWIKRGPTGILGTNKRDAEETVDRLAEDLASGALKPRRLPGREAIDSLIRGRKPDVVTADGWRAIDARELELGEAAQRPRVKLASRDELLAAGSQ